MSRHRSWCFTINNYTDDDIEALDALESKYLVYGKEVGENGTPHLQGYVVWNNPITFGGCKKRLGTAHIEVAKGNAEQNYEYCTKDGDFYESGTKPQQGARTDLKKIKSRILNGDRIDSVVLEECENVQQIRFAEMLKKFCPPPERQEPEVYWLYGPTGTGKTRWCQQHFTDAWWAGETLQWWQGYFGQRVVIIDDFRGDMCKFHWLLRILDRYPAMVPNKGGSCWLEAEVIIITSPFHPMRVFHDREDMQQLIRRIDHIICTDTEVQGNTNNLDCDIL